MDTYTNQSSLQAGDEVWLFKVGQDEPVDKGIIIRITLDEELCFKSTQSFLGRETEFGRSLSPEYFGWLMLFEDPFQPGIRCFSRRGPEYLFHRSA